MTTPIEALVAATESIQTLLTQLTSERSVLLASIPSPASAPEVTTGTVTNKYVSPATLKGSLDANIAQITSLSTSLQTQFNTLQATVLGQLSSLAVSHDNTLTGNGFTTQLGVNPARTIRAWGVVIGGILVANGNIDSIGHSSGSSDYDIHISTNAGFTDNKYTVIAGPRLESVNGWATHSFRNTSTPTYCKVTTWWLPLGMPAGVEMDFGFIIVG